jgi:hypothetical protein
MICDIERSGSETEQVLLQEFLREVEAGLDPSKNVRRELLNLVTPLTRYLAMCADMSRDHKVILAQPGTLGMASPLSNVGDQLCIFFSSRAPYIVPEIE